MIHIIINIWRNTHIRKTLNYLPNQQLRVFIEIHIQNYSIHKHVSFYVIIELIQVLLLSSSVVLFQFLISCLVSLRFLLVLIFIKKDYNIHIRYMYFIKIKINQQERKYVCLLCWVGWRRGIRRDAPSGQAMVLLPGFPGCLLFKL